MRTCRSCGLTQELEKFSKAGIIKGVQYYRHLCVPCYSDFKNDRRVELREWYFEWKKTLKCEQCGFDDYRALQFDHKDRSTKVFEIGNAVSSSFSKEKILSEAAKCQVLCSNCHSIKTFEESRGVG